MNRQQRRARGIPAAAAQVASPALLEMFTDAVRQHRAGQLANAETLYRRILAADPRHADSMHLLGVLAHQAGRNERASDLIGRAIAINGKVASYHYNLGNALVGQNRLDDAAACFRRAVALQPDHADACGNLGSILTMQGRFDDGIACLREVVRLRPDHADAHYNLGTALARRWAVDEAATSLRRAVELRPNADACNNLANLLKDCARPEEALAAYDQALAIRPDDLALHSNRLLVQNYLLQQPPDVLLDLARAFGVLASARAGRRFTDWPAQASGGPLRIGLVSNDLHNHPVGYFLEGLLRHADPGRVVFLAFPCHREEDDLTARIKPYCKSWTSLDGLGDEAAARLIHASGVQLLLDLSGHTAGNRLPVFAWRPAPVQATWLGYFATTGLAEMDYIIADPNVAPPEPATPFVETVWPLPETYYCFTPPIPSTEVSPLPARANGGVTFGCFNNLAKINDAVVAVWARLLDAVPDSRLVLKSAPFHDGRVGAALRARFAARGVAEHRVLLEPASSRADYLRAYDRIDIALDPFPFPGGATSCEALWMGVPLLTRKGDRFLSRVGETIVRNAGLSEWLAADDDDYVQKAVHFASDLDHLAQLRRGLREQVLASPLFDAGRFAQHFEAAAWGMWGRWLGRQPPASPAGAAGMRFSRL